MTPTYHAHRPRELRWCVPGVGYTRRGVALAYMERTLSRSDAKSTLDEIEKTALLNAPILWADKTYRVKDLGSDFRFDPLASRSRQWSISTRDGHRAFVTKDLAIRLLRDRGQTAKSAAAILERVRQDAIKRL